VTSHGGDSDGDSGPHTVVASALRRQPDAPHRATVCTLVVCREGSYPYGRDVSTGVGSHRVCWERKI
jgi:hypothetical protein